MVRSDSVRVAVIVAAAIVAGACGRATAPDPRFAGLSVVFRGHREIVEAKPNQWEPLVVDESPTVGICVMTDPLVDTSQWQARWSIDKGPPTKYDSAKQRLERTACFWAPLPLTTSAGAHRLCPELQDQFDGAQTSLECLAFHRLGDRQRYKQLSDATEKAKASHETLTPDEYIAQLEAASRTSLESGFPLLATRARMIAIYALRGRGTSEDWKKIDAYLSERPAFLSAPAALKWAGEFELASYFSRADRNIELKQAWQSLGVADDAFQRSRWDSWPVPRVRQADLIASAGSPGEARTRMTELSDACRTYGCLQQLINVVHGTHAWHTLLDFDASSADLTQAQIELREAIESKLPDEDALVIVNRWVNLAFARLRAGDDPRAALSEVHRALENQDVGGSGRSGLYAAWARIIEGLYRLRRGDPGAALSLCRQSSQLSTWPQLAAQSLSCRARAFRALGKVQQARQEIERALTIHAALTGATIGQAISLGPGQRAEDFYLAADLAIEAGDMASAWETLEALDTVSTLQADRARCQNQDDDERQRKQSQLTAALETLSGPVPIDRISQRQGAALSLRKTLQELVRQSGNCDPAEGTNSGQPEARLFAVADAVVSLWRSAPDGAVTVQRVPLAQQERTRRLDALEAGMRRGISKPEWDSLAEPFAKALVPWRRSSAELVHIALYGSMQRVPVNALASPTGDDSRWGASTTIVVVPSRVMATFEPTESLDSPPLFIVDPRRNLGAGAALSALYRRLFPGSTLIEGPAATRTAITAALANHARWVHFDGHGRFDPAFPELSSLQLADGEMLTDQLAHLASAGELINLSGCQTGRSPVTADSGQFGPARALLNRGVGWVIASRTDLQDEVALAFNTEFYGAVSSGRSTAEAFRTAIASLARTRPPASWAGLILLGHPAK